MPTFTLPLIAAVEAFATVAPFTASTKDALVTPVLGTVRLTPGQVTASDRYAVGRYRSPLIACDEEDGNAEILIPADAVAHLATIKRTSLRDPRTGIPTSRTDWGSDNYVVTIEQPDDGATVPEVTVSITSQVRETGKPERSRSFDGHRLNFPPVDRLFPTEDAETGEAFAPLGAWQIERLAKVAKMFGKDVPVILRAGDNTGGSKSAPLHFQVHNMPLDGLIQPTLIH